MARQAVARGLVVGQALPPRRRVEARDRSARREVHGPPVRLATQEVPLGHDLPRSRAVRDRCVGAGHPWTSADAPTPPRLAALSERPRDLRLESVLSSRESVFSERETRRETNTLVFLLSRKLQRRSRSFSLFARVAQGAAWAATPSPARARSSARWTTATTPPRPSSPASWTRTACPRCRRDISAEIFAKKPPPKKNPLDSTPSLFDRRAPTSPRDATAETRDDARDAREAKTASFTRVDRPRTVLYIGTV